jgi:hypothetical protein
MLSDATEQNNDNIENKIKKIKRKRVQSAKIRKVAPNDNNQNLDILQTYH